ncbi:MAG: DUF5686 and carboxypeptidase regulatory-like domain-containing protein [Ignavibacterium sp.]|nr:DUF5686 and carboxypeptidase regulatory-like domain-containing protein [Ignavibacterium sp.]
MIRFISKLIIFMFIIWYQSTNIFPQVFSIKGKIYDKENNSPLIYANIRVANSTLGTSSNSNGEFELKLERGSYFLIASYIGYVADTISINVNNDLSNIKIFLKPTEINLPEIVVKPGENPAIEIIKKAIEKRKQRDSLIKNYEFESFAKGTIKTTEFITSSTSAFRLGVGSSDTSKLKVTGILESHTKGYFEKPNNYKEIILARKQSSNFPSSINLLTGGRLVQNFYNDDINFFGRKLPGILSDEALRYYYFYIEKLTAINNQKVFQIHIEPNDSLDPGLVGKIFILENTYELLKADLTLNKAANIGGIFENVNIIQQFDRFENVMMPVDYRLFVKANFLGIARFGFELNTILFNYKINSNLERSIFSKAVISVLPDADKKDSSYWTTIQTIPNTEEEIEAFRIIDSLQSIPRKFWDDFSLLNSQINLNENISISAPLRMYHFNRVEGHTLDFGIFMNELLDMRLNSNLSISYGFSDKKFKQEINTSYLLGDYRTTRIDFNIFNTKRILLKRQTNELSEFYNTITSLFLKDDDKDYFYQRGFDFEFQTELTSIVKAKLSLSNRTDKSARKNTDFSIFRRSRLFDDNPPIAEGKSNILGFQLTFDFRDYIEDGYFRRRAAFGKDYFIFSLGFKYSDDDFLNSNFSFKQYEFSYQTFIRTFSFSILTMRFFAGLSSGNVPPQLMYALPGNPRLLSSSNTFRTLRTYEVFGDRVIYLNIEHDFRDELFRALSLNFLTKFDLQLNSFLNAGWSNLKNNLTDINLFYTQTLKKPLVEIGFGLRKGFIPVEVEFAWKMINSFGRPFRISLNSSFLF